MLNQKIRVLSNNVFACSPCGSGRLGGEVEIEIIELENAGMVGPLVWYKVNDPNELKNYIPLKSIEFIG